MRRGSAEQHHILTRSSGLRMHAAGTEETGGSVFFCLCMPPSCTGAHPILQSAVKIEGLPPSRVGSTMFGLAVARGANETPPKCVGNAGCGRSSLQSRSSSGPLKRQKCLVLVTALAALNSGGNPRLQKTAVSGCDARGECHNVTAGEDDDKRRAPRENKMST